MFLIALGGGFGEVMNPRGRYPPGIGNGGRGDYGANPNFYGRNPQLQQQYVPRNQLQSQQNQQFQQQQWMGRNRMGSNSGSGEAAAIAVQPNGVDSRYEERSIGAFI